MKKYSRVAGCIANNFLGQEAVYPFYASYKLTNKCNMRCKFCNVWMEKIPELSTEGVFKVLDNLGNSSITLLSLEGGEPLQRKDLGEILRYASTKPFYIFFTTNGLLLDRSPMDEYGKYIDYLHISIDEAHNNLDMLERIEEFQELGVMLQCLRIVITAVHAHMAAVVWAAVEFDHKNRPAWIHIVLDHVGQRLEIPFHRGDIHRVQIGRHLPCRFPGGRDSFPRNAIGVLREYVAVLEEILRQV